MNTPSSPERYAKLILVPLILASLWSPHAAGDQTTLNPSRDATIFSESGSEANGSGNLFLGRNNNGNFRRTLLFFDIVNGDGQNSGVPAGATINSVTLTLSVSNSAGGTASTDLRKLTRDWNEGPAGNVGNGGGRGDSAGASDVTWTQTGAGANWTTQGGDRSGTDSATLTITDNSPDWSSAQMAMDVQEWLDTPSMNFGWIIVGNESASTRNARRFGSKETGTDPQLLIDFTPAGGMMQDQTITFGALDDKFVDDADFEVSATASSGLTVAFSVESGPATISGTTVSLDGTEGTVTIRASQPGDSNFNAAPDVDQSFDVSKRDQTITFDALSNKETTDPPFDVAATSDSGLTVTFSVESGPATIDGNTVTLTGEEGTVTIRASQAGDGVYNAAVDVDQSFNVGAPAPQDQTITFGALDDKFVDDADFGVSATASSGLTVAFSVESGPATINGTTVSLNGTEGMVTIRASQPGDSNFNAAPNVDQSFDVSKRDQTITFDALGNKETTDPPFDVTATPDSGLTVTFSVESGPATIDGNTVTLTGEEGTVTIRASQAGDNTYNAAGDVDQMFNVGAPAPQDQTITFNPIADATFGLERITLDATASSGLSVSYAVVSGPGLLNPDNSLSLTGPGTVTIRASQAGNSSFNPAEDVDQSFSVTQPSSGGASLLTAGDAKYVNDGTEFMGNTYNGFELGGSTGTFSSIAGNITRISFLDENGDLMFAEFGAGDPNVVVVITLDPFRGADLPSPYNQPGTVYAQGHPRIEILNSSNATFVALFSLGNDPSRVDNSIILVGTLADPVNGIADVQSLTISDGATQIGGIGAANANFTGTDGIIGIDAPDVVVGVFLFVGDITPMGTAMPVLRVSADSMLDDLFITGGDLAEAMGMFEIDTNGVVYPFPITATDGQRSINGSPFRTDLGDGSLDPVSDTFAASIDDFFVTDGQMTRVNQ